MKKINLGVIFGGRSSEHEVSIVSAKSVCEKIDKKKYNLVQIGITPQGKWMYSKNTIEDFQKNKIKNLEPVSISLNPDEKKLIILNKAGKEICKLDVVFPVLHGSFGEDGTIQGLFEMANVPYVGCGVTSSGICFDKITTKMMLDKAGVPNTKYLWFERDNYRKNKSSLIKNIVNDIKFPCFVKPSRQGSSVGVSKAKNEKSLIKAIDDACKFDSKILIEKGITGKEIECAILGNGNPKASAVGQILPAGEFYDFFDKYVDGKSRTRIPADISKKAQEEFQLMALKTYKTLGCAGLARVDGFYSDEDKALYINEINTLPGFTSISMYPKMWEYSGIKFKELLEKLIDLAFDEHKEKNANQIMFDSKSDWFKK